MIARLKNILGDNSVDEISTKINEHSDIIQKQNQLIIELRDNLVKVIEELKHFKEEHNILQQVFDSNLDRVKQLKVEFEKEITDFKMLKNRLHESITDRTCDALNNKLAPHLERMKTDIHSYNSLKDNLENVSQTLNEFKQEVQRLKMISGKIRDTDFDLKRYADKIAHEDKHKLELMQKIETLQKLIAHERRRNSY